MVTLLLVEAGHYAQAGVVVDLEDPCLELLVDQDVKTKDLEWGSLDHFIRLDFLTLVMQNHLHEHRCGSFASLFDVGSQLLNLFCSLDFLELFEKRSESPFRALVNLVDILDPFITNEFFPVLVQRIICQVHVALCPVVFIWLPVLLRTEAC